MDLLITILTGWGIIALIFTALWLLSVKQTNAGWVDVGWSFTLVVLVGWYALQGDGVAWRKLFYFAIAAFWGLRLAWHILQRLLRDDEEDGRYAFLREHFGKKANRNFFFFFQVQGVANLLLTAPILLLLQAPVESFRIWDLLGLLIIVGSVAGEALADAQLSRWKSNPENKGKTCRRGLWAVSRHPNYFFEWLHWVGYPVLGIILIGTPLALYWPLTLLGPAIMLALLLQFTGIPYTEKQSLKSRGENYRKYQEEVSPFIPWFPKSKS